MDNEIIKQYLKNNLTISVDEEYYGFNGIHIVIKLKIDDDVIDEDYIDVRRDEG